MKDQKDALQQRPEDFMDEEDRREAEESKVLSTNDDFAGFGSTEDDAKRKGAFLDLFRPSGEPKGVQLLRRMGWREGQGIGPKVRRKIKTDDQDDAEDEYHLLPPENPDLIAFVHKTDHKGLGYGGEPRLELQHRNTISRSTSRPRDEHSEDEEGLGPAFTAPNSKKPKDSKRKGGFGVGILNDTGSDDEDPYEMGPKISYTRTIGGEKANKKASLGGSNPLLRTKPTFVSKKAVTAKSSSGFRKCHDGRYPPEGFVLSSQLDAFASMVLDDDSLKPPEVPKDWKSSKTPEAMQGDQSFVSTADAARQSTMDAKGRAALLGETQLPGKSVFDFLTPAARERILQSSGKSNLPAALSEKPPPGFETSENDKQRSLDALVPALDADVALQALNRGIGGWMPYAEDENKRARYRAFLEIRAGLRQGLPEKPSDMSRDNWVTELNEFARAAQVFKPVTGLMASRFTSSSTQPKASSDQLASEKESLLSQPASKPEDPAEQAAKLGMFGPMTRSTSTFSPTRLLCKRFNVKPPANVSFDPDDGAGSASTASASIPVVGRFQSAGFENAGKPTVEVTSNIDTQQGSGSTSSPDQGASVTLDAPQPQSIVIDAERNEALEAERPGEAVFKAIFGSDDEDE